MSQSKPSVPEFVAKAPIQYQQIWENKLSESVKQVLCEQAKNYKLKTPEQIERFWLGRNFDKIVNEASSLDAIARTKINERMTSLHESKVKSNDPLVAMCNLLR